MEKHITRCALANETLYKAQATLGLALLGDETTQKQQRKARREAAEAASEAHQAVSRFEEAYGLNQKNRQKLQTLLHEAYEAKHELAWHEALFKIANELGIQPFAIGEETMA